MLADVLKTRVTFRGHENDYGNCDDHGRASFFAVKTFQPERGCDSRRVCVRDVSREANVEQFVLCEFFSRKIFPRAFIFSIIHDGA